MKLISLMAGSLLLTSVAIAEESSANPENGRKLLSTAHCLSCACLDELVGVDDKIKSLTELENSVRSCDADLNINWYDDQLLDVVAYLNQTYYKFEKPVEQSSIDVESAADPTANKDKKVVASNANGE